MILVLLAVLVILVLLAVLEVLLVLEVLVDLVLQNHHHLHHLNNTLVLEVLVETTLFGPRWSHDGVMASCCGFVWFERVFDHGRIIWHPSMVSIMGVSYSTLQCFSCVAPLIGCLARSVRLPPRTTTCPATLRSSSLAGSPASGSPSDGAPDRK